MDQQQIANNLSVTLVQHVHDRATLVNSHEDLVTHVNSTHKTDDGAPNKTYVAMSVKDKTRDINHNIVHDLPHHIAIAHTTIDQLSICERQNLQALSTVNFQQTQARI